MTGRLSLEAEITTGTTPVPPIILDGDDIEYPQEDIPVGYMRKYTEQYISDIATAIKAVNGSEDDYTTQEMSGAISDIGDTIAALNERIVELEGEIPPEIDNVVYPTT